jgi:hypothetical protein
LELREEKNGSCRGQVWLTFAGDYIHPHKCLLKLEWLHVDTRRIHLANEKVRPHSEALLLQIALQLARLSGVPRTLLDYAPLDTLPLYRSLGFFRLGTIKDQKNPKTTMFIEPQHAFNTVTGLLHTHASDPPAEHHNEVAKLPTDMQVVYHLLYQHWVAMKPTTDHHVEYQPELRFDLSICNVPGKQSADEGLNAQLVVYGRASIHVRDGVVKVEELVQGSATSDTPWVTLKGALLAIGNGMGQDIANRAWHSG